MTTPNFVYFGGEPIGVPVLVELEKAGLLPSIVVCNPDRPVGRKQVLTAPPVKEWALEHNIEVFQPETLKEKESLLKKLSGFDLFVVVAYNKIMPKWLIELPSHGTLNVHPSLLPLLRGASPIRSTILEDMQEQCGVTIMQMDEKMDHGPIVAQEGLAISAEEWPVHGTWLDAELAKQGGRLLAETIPQWVRGEIQEREQFHSAATYCGRLDRSMGELSIDPHNLPTGEEAYKALLKIRAFEGFPGTYFIYKGKRVKITEAQIKNNSLNIERVIPEGKQEMSFDKYTQSL